MLDKNGVEILTGMVVEITGAYFKNDNGLWFVDNSPGDPSWCGSDHSLKKISKTGKLSVAKHNICFWPIAVFVSDRCKRAEAGRWNVAEIVAHFEAKAEATEERILWTIRHFGEDHSEVELNRSLKAHYLAVAEAVRKGER